MKKVGTVTFHSAYNFGSCLQAYALQEFVEKLFEEKNQKVEYKIINLRTLDQEKLYNYKKKDKGIKKLIKDILIGKKMKIKSQRFENFINNDLKLTNKTYRNNEELKKENLNFDYYISGSDQIWNYEAFDFDWAYMLNFVNKGKKISYAASFGPKDRKLTKEVEQKISKLLNMYDNISVREEPTLKKMKNYTNKPMEVNVDPTILLSKDDWLKLVKDIEIYKDKYLLFYTLKMSKERMKFVKKIAKKLNLKVVIMTPNIKYDFIRSVIRKYDTGPKEFVKLIENAQLVISSSFHGTVFSILMEKPFYSLDGLKDDRIRNLLSETNFEDRGISVIEDINLKDAYNIDFSEAKKYIKKETQKSKEYLIKALEL